MARMVRQWERLLAADGVIDVSAVRALVEGGAQRRYNKLWLLLTLEAWYGRWIAGRTGRIGLGTSIVLVPLHNPMHLAKQVATLQELSGGRFTLGVGMRWHKDDFDFMGVEFDGLLLKQLIKVGIAAVDIGAAFDDKGLEAGRRVAEGAAAAPYNILQRFLGVSLDIGRPFHRPKPDPDAHRLEVVEYRLADIGVGRVA